MKHECSEVCERVDSRQCCFACDLRKNCDSACLSAECSTATDILRARGVNIPKETRLESFLKTTSSERKRLILSTLGDREMTARQIARELGFTDLNAVKPRLTELKKEGVLYCSGKAYDELTERNVALFRRTSDD